MKSRKKPPYEQRLMMMIERCHEAIGEAEMCELDTKSAELETSRGFADAHSALMVLAELAPELDPYGTRVVH